MTLAAPILIELNTARSRVRDGNTRRKCVHVDRTRPEVGAICGSEDIGVITEVDCELVTWLEVEVLEMQQQKLCASRSLGGIEYGRPRRDSHRRNNLNGTDYVRHDSHSRYRSGYC